MMTKMPITANTYSTVLIGCLLSDVFCNQYNRRKGKESVRVLHGILCTEGTLVIINNVIINSMSAHAQTTENEDVRE